MALGAVNWWLLVFSTAGASHNETVPQRNAQGSAWGQSPFPVQLHSQAKQRAPVAERSRCSSTRGESSSSLLPCTEPCQVNFPAPSHGDRQSPPWAAPGGGSCGKGRDTSCAGSAAGPVAGGELQGAWQGAPCLGRWIRCAMRQTEHHCLYPAAEHFGGPVISPSLIIEQRVCRAGARTAFLK